MTKKEKFEAAQLSRDSISEKVGIITANSIERERLVAKMNKQLDEVRANFAERIECCDAEVKAATEIVQAWAEAHRDEAFHGAQSIEFARGTVGFRLGKFRVVTTKGVTLDDVVKALHTLPWGKQFIRSVEEVDKAAILANKDSLTAAQMAKAGIAIEQEERFYIEPKQDEPQPVEG